MVLRFENYFFVVSLMKIRDISRLRFSASPHVARHVGKGRMCIYLPGSTTICKVWKQRYFVLRSATS